VDFGARQIVDIGTSAGWVLERGPMTASLVDPPRRMAERPKASPVVAFHGDQELRASRDAAVGRPSADLRSRQSLTGTG
jgi:hypothetical protein